MEIFLLYISNDKPMFTGVKQGVYRVETWCLKPMFTWVFTGVKQGVLGLCLQAYVSEK